jgi:hypothetical protein
VPNHYVIGAGGVGSWLVPKLCRIERNLVIIDGDTLEEKNLDRQLFDRHQIGANKAKALAEKYIHDHGFREEYFSRNLLRLEKSDWLWCAADNHACRREVLAACDQYRCRAIIMANEYVDAEAYYFQPDMAGTPNDPRVFYPEINTDRSGDPLGPPGCVQAAKDSPQLVLANAMAADLGGWLFWHWTRTIKDIPEDAWEFSPVHLKMNPMGPRNIKLGDRLKGE